MKNFIVMDTENKDHIFRRFKYSIYKGPINPREDKSRIRLAINSLVLHLHPSRIDENVLRFNHTFGLGGMAIVLICLLFFTGLLLRFNYVPFPGKAYESILSMQQNNMFGQLIRNIHYWSGMLLVIVSFLHLFRVFFTGAFHNKRQFNWVIGIALLLLVIFSNFTGYLLPWDQLSYWAVTVATSMLEYVPLIGTTLTELARGGIDVNESTLLIFYNLHTGVFPILIILIMAFHFWRVRKAGGVIIPSNDNSESKMVTTIPHLVGREFVVALVLIAFIIFLSLLFNAPLLEKANPDYSPNPAKAPWYFLGIQELMLHFHPLISAVILPFFLIVLSLLIPYIIYDTGATGIWFYSDKGKKLSAESAIVTMGITSIFILLNEYFIDYSSWFDFLPSVISTGIIPLILLIIPFMGFHYFIRNKFVPNKNELVQTYFVIIFTFIIVLTITGIFFRGPGMKLFG